MQLSIMQFFLMILAALLFAVGGLFMKASDGLTKIAPSAAVFVLFCAGAACQALAMKRGEMSAIYVIVLGLEAIAAFSLGTAILGEKSSFTKLCALVFIIGGIALLERPS
jgi:multidrug transporter EmrE-like cation transporter